MKKDFVPNEQSLQLKELGFDEPCFGWYTLEGDGAKPIFVFEYCLKQDIGLCLAPTFSQAFRFFREKHNLYGFITSATHPDRKLRFSFHIVDNWDVNEIFDTPEEAEIACLNKLIEIVKNKYMSDTITLNRRFLVETLENLLTDEFDSSELVHLTNDELVLRIIEAAEFYKSWNE
jgi:hypothetical protein